MQEHPLLAAFARLLADFLGIPENDPEILKIVLERCAQALVQGQDPTSMRDTFEFERIQHFTTQYLNREDRDQLNGLLGQAPPAGQSAYRVFLREMPNRATWLRSSIRQY